MSVLLQHHNEKIFPSSHQFIPERWILEDGTINRALERYLVSFSRGTRNCIGQVYVYLHLQSEFQSQPQPQPSTSVPPTSVPTLTSTYLAILTILLHYILVINCSQL